MIPNDPVMLLSYVNTQLRDYYSSLDALCEDKGIGKEELVEKMKSIEYVYEWIETSLCDKGSIPAKKVGVLLFLISNLNKVLTES